MKLLLELSMECESLARAEALAAAAALGGEARILLREPGVLIIETPAKPERLAERFALCHYVSEWLGSGTADTLDSIANDVDVEGPIRVRSTKIGESAVDLAAVARRIGGVIGETRGVDLRHPATDIRVVFSKKVHIGRVLGTIDRSAFENRKNKNLPYVYPASLHPKYARALVNLTQVAPGGKLLDPFCGTGAIVAEAALMGLKAIGTDFSEKMIEGAKRNLKHLDVSAELKVCDVGAIADAVGHVNGIATDPPYGRSTSTDGEKIPDLYRRSFEAFSRIMRKGSVLAIVVPDIDLLEVADGFKLVEKHSLWVHRSLTRHFCVLGRL